MRPGLQSFAPQRLTHLIAAADGIGTQQRLRVAAHQVHGGVYQVPYPVQPQLRPADTELPVLSWIDPENFNPGYIMRGIHLLPRRLDVPEWQHTQDYWAEKHSLPAADLDDGCLAYE